MTKLFATIRPLRLECPSCLHMILFGPGEPHRLAYDRFSSRLTCPNCGAVYTLGLLVWPVQKRSFGKVPEDHLPTRRQLAELRAYAGGFWVEQAHKSGDPANRYIAAGCTCEAYGSPGDCPVHGNLWGAKVDQKPEPTK